MTTGHKHRTIHLPPNSARLHLLQTPVRRSADEQHVDASRYAWGAEDRDEITTHDGRVVSVNPHPGTIWRLTPLGILHGWLGLTVDTGPRPEKGNT